MSHATPCIESVNQGAGVSAPAIMHAATFYYFTYAYTYAEPERFIQLSFGDAMSSL